MKLTTPEKIRQLQRKLYEKAKQDSKFRFYALYDKMYRPDILLHAYHLVRANQGSPGTDRVSFSAIESGEGVSEFLAGLEDPDFSSLEEGACFDMKNIGKPCTGKPYARFDESGLEEHTRFGYLGTVRRKGRKRISHV